MFASSSVPRGRRMGRGLWPPGLKNDPMALLRGSRRKANSVRRYGRCPPLGLLPCPVNCRSLIYGCWRPVAPKRLRSCSTETKPSWSNGRHRCGYANSNTLSVSGLPMPTPTTSPSANPTPSRPGDCSSRNGTLDPEQGRIVAAAVSHATRVWTDPIRRSTSNPATTNRPQTRRNHPPHSQIPDRSKSTCELLAPEEVLSMILGILLASSLVVDRLARSSTASHREVTQARVLLLLAEGRSVRSTK